MSAWESAPPFILIALAIAGMGHFQARLHSSAQGALRGPLPASAAVWATTLFTLWTAGRRAGFTWACTASRRPCAADEWDRQAARRDAKIQVELAEIKRREEGPKKGWFS